MHFIDLYEFFPLSFFSRLIMVPYYRSPPSIPEVVVPEDATVKTALALRFEVNRALFVLREIALGRDLKKFLAVSFDCL